MSISSGNLESSPIHNIRTLNPLEAIQMRPAMYLGDVGVKGLHKMLDTLLVRVLTKPDNKVPDIDISIQENNSVIVQYAIDANTECLIDLPSELTNYKQRPCSSLAVINALSSDLEITFRIGEKVYCQNYKQGKPVTELQLLESADLKGVVMIHFKPDETLFAEIIFDIQRISKRLWELACLNQGVRFSLSGKKGPFGESKPQKFQAKNGLSELISTLNNLPNLLLSNTFRLNQSRVQVAFNYQASCIEKIQCYVNNEPISGAGTHLTGFRRALTSSLKSFARNNGVSGAEKLKGKDFKKGLIAVVSVNLENAIFENTIRAKLLNPEVARLVYKKVLTALQLFWEQYPEQAETILYKAVKDYDKPLVKHNPRI